MTITLKTWQIKAYNAWIKNNYKGIIVAVTGSGKTYLGLRVIENFPTSRTIIIVPTVNLLDQWYDEIVNKLNIPSNQVGRIGGGHNDEQNITIAVINSVRNRKVSYDNLILDEAHHYLADSNTRLLDNNTFIRTLAFSATINRGDNKTYKKYNLNTIYTYTQSEAIKAGDLSCYELKNISVDLNDAEKERYDRHEATFKKHIKDFPNFGEIYAKPFSFKKAALRRAINGRKTIVNNSTNKIVEAVAIIHKHKKNKVIVFTELQKTTDAISRLLSKNNVCHGIYHTGIKDRKMLLENFKSGQFNILLTVKALDEGLDVPDCDIGIIVAGNKSPRQIIQRMGRILRKKAHCAIMYQIYVRNTVDEKYLRARLSNLKGYSKISWS